MHTAYHMQCDSIYKPIELKCGFEKICNKGHCFDAGSKLLNHVWLCSVFTSHFTKQNH